MRLGAVVTLAAVGALLTRVQPARAQRAPETYARAYLDSLSRLRIVTSHGRRVTPRKRDGQVGFAQPRISSDHKSVGWLAVHPNGGSTTPIPMELVVLSSGRERAFDGDGLAVWGWAFSPDGRRVILEKGPVHGQHREFEQRDIRTGRRISSFEVDSVVVKRLPKWARVVGVADRR